MEKDHWIFLTRQEVLDAVAIDFQQYGPQPEVFEKITPLILNQRNIPQDQEKAPDPTDPSGPDPSWPAMGGKDMGASLCQRMGKGNLPLEIMARICAIVFQTRARPGRMPEKNDHGVWIETHMKGFVCCRCGHCCSGLGYENDCDEDDYLQWQALGRRDILERVRVIPNRGGAPRYRIWLDEGSGDLASTCPWLAAAPEKKGFICLIQEVKPAVCRQYPFTRKHAMMTGCRGKFAPD